MDQDQIRKFLNDYKEGVISEDEIIKSLKRNPYEDMDFAKVDLHRGLRQGVSEVIYGQGKTPDQIIKISKKLLESQEGVLITRLTKDKAQIIEKDLPLKYYEMGNIGLLGKMKDKTSGGKILIASGGTSDMMVCEEAALTSEFLGNEVERLYDVGVAGIHRLFNNIDKILDARVIIAVAGMEGALASVIAGLADCPVIAVPTSIGYGAAFNGLAALLSMLNSCASGVSVVNIDNGFGAAYQASLINQIRSKWWRVFILN